MSVCLSVFLSTSLCTCESITPSIGQCSNGLSVNMSICLYLSICLVCLPVYMLLSGYAILSIYISVCISVCLKISLFYWTSVYLWVSMTNYLSTCPRSSIKLPLVSDVIQSKLHLFCLENWINWIYIFSRKVPESS